MTIYDFEVKTIRGEVQSLKDFSGKVILIVNTASECGFTPQYEGLQKLYEKYKARGFEILGFPSNQFGAQEPGTNDEIIEFCQLNYGVTFPMYAKVDVKGENAEPLFKYLSKEAPGILGSKSIKWNFTKFLIDSNGNVIKRFASTDGPEKLEEDILHLLGK
ncbi:glutathione peroxidase [Bacillus sp. CGMCC 1.16607]|uniref:glutathione peroxidase n=1 Tax=Bacillus sp. CGMCC 1.16607 TaxID=3351842 RepID=UPI00362BCEB5